MKKFLFALTLVFSTQAFSTFCEVTWENQYKELLSVNVDRFVQDTKNQLITAFANSGIQITTADIAFELIPASSQFTRYSANSGYYFNFYRSTEATIEIAGKKYTFILEPQSMGAINSEPFLIGTFVREIHESNSVGDIHRAQCSAATGFYGTSAILNGNFEPITHFRIKRKETNILVGATTKLAPPTHGYAEQSIIEIKP